MATIVIASFDTVISSSSMHFVIAYIEAAIRIIAPKLAFHLYCPLRG
jgi:hypothetical protein